MGHLGKLEKMRLVCLLGLQLIAFVNYNRISSLLKVLSEF